MKVLSAYMYVLYLSTIGDMLKDSIVCKPLPGEDGGLPVSLQAELQMNMFFDPVKPQRASFANHPIHTSSLYSAI